MSTETVVCLCLCVCMSVCLYVCLSVCVFVCPVAAEPALQRKKRSTSLSPASRGLSTVCDYVSQNNKLGLQLVLQDSQLRHPE